MAQLPKIVNPLSDYFGQNYLSQANQNLQNQAANNMQQSQYNHQYNQLACSGQGYTTTTVNTAQYPFVATGIGGGGGMGAGGIYPQQQIGAQIPSPFNAVPSGPAMGMLVDLVFAAVECHLRKVIREEINKSGLVSSSDEFKNTVECSK